MHTCDPPLADAHIHQLSRLLKLNLVWQLSSSRQEWSRCTAVASGSRSGRGSSSPGEQLQLYIGPVSFRPAPILHSMCGWERVVLLAGSAVGSG